MQPGPFIIIIIIITLVSSLHC